MLKSMTFRATLTVLACGITASAYAIADTPKKVDVPAGELSVALQRLAEQSGVEFVYSAEQLKGVRTNGVQGEYTADKAVTKLLEGTPLKLTIHESGALLISDVNAPGSSTPPPSTGAGAVAPVTTSSSSEVSAEASEKEIPNSFWRRFRLAQNDSTRSTDTTSGTDARTDQAGGPERLTLEEVIVTAQRREERLQDVPISISVLGGEELEKARTEGLTEILRRIPGVTAPTGSLASPVIAIRGVAPSTIAFGGSRTAAYYLDSTPYGFVRSALAPDTDVYDLDRVEVLRGPQGTLFGANAQSGVVRVLTRDPDLSDYEFKTRAMVIGGDSTDFSYRGDMAANLPLVEDKLALRAVVGYNDRGGWIDKPDNKNADDATITNMRLKLKAQLTDDLSIVGGAWLRRYRADAQSIGRDDGTNVVARDEPVHTDTDNYSIRLTNNFDTFSMTSSTSYQEYKTLSTLDLVVFANPNTQQSELFSDVFSQELTLASSGEGPWKWSGGASYRDVSDRVHQVFIANPTPLTDYSDESESWATFGELTRVLADGRFEITAGLRYFEDQQRTYENANTIGFPTGMLINEQEKFDALTPRAVVSWHPNRDLMVYATYGEGFRSGVIQNPSVQRATPGLPGGEPDRLHNYEIGTKGEVAGGLLTFDAAAYFLDWKDVQQRLAVFYSPTTGQVSSTPIPNSTIVTAVLNGPSASGPGAEIAATLHPVAGLSVGGTFGWNDLTLDSDVISGGVVRFPKGARLASSPKYTAGMFVDYEYSFDGGFVGTFSAAANYTSAILDPAIVNGVRQSTADGDSILIARSSFTVDTPNHWSVSFFVDNISDERDPTTRIAGVPTWNFLNTRPRSYGIQVDYRL